ncbi:MAG: tetratricopeptide repeat protein [Candidatus Aminicenantes bacterium]|nr:tetratricopeptide repeat protein [Candidatus Aminicenantes bacterium]
MKKTTIFLFCFSLLFVVQSQAELVKKEEGIKALNSGNYDLAIKIFKDGVNKEGDSGKLASYCSFFLGRAYYGKGQMEEAIKYLKRAIEVYKEGMTVFGLDPAWYYWLGRAYYETDQYDKAIVSFQKAASIADENPESFFEYYYKNFYRSTADRVKNALLPHMPPKYSCYFYLGNSYYMNGQFQEAVEVFTKAIELNPKAEDFYTHLANAYLALNQFEKAIQIAKKSIAVEQNNPFAYHILSKIYRAMGKYDEAINSLKRAVELAPKFIERHISLANLYAEIGNYDQAISVLTKALEISPENRNAHTYLTYYYMSASRFDEAINSVNKLIELNTIKGIGTYFSFEEDYPVVVLVEGTVPYNPAGLQNGDRIIKVNGQSTKGNRDKFFQSLGGSEGTQLTLTIKRNGLKEPIEQKVTLGKVLMKSAATPLAMRSFIQAIKGNLEQSGQDAEMAYSLDKENPWAFSAISFAYIRESPPLTREGKITEALRILSGSKDNFDRLLEALAYSKMGDLKHSLDIYTSLPEEYLQSQNAFHRLFREAVLESLTPYLENKKESARSLEAGGQYSDALKEYAELLKIADEKEAREIRTKVAVILKARPEMAELPEEARRYVMRAEMASKESQFEDALQEYKKAVKIAPFTPALYKGLALSYEGLKDYRRAISNMNIYLELYPEAPDAREVKDQIYKWEYMLEKGGK